MTPSSWYVECFFSKDLTISVIDWKWNISVKVFYTLGDRPDSFLWSAICSNTFSVGAIVLERGQFWHILKMHNCLCLPLSINLEKENFNVEQCFFYETYTFTTVVECYYFSTLACEEIVEGAEESNPVVRKSLKCIRWLMVKLMSRKL